MIFVDTSAWYAIAVPDDEKHRQVAGWLQANPLPLVTSDYVADETLTLLRSRGEHAKAIGLGRTFFDLQSQIRVIRLDDSDVRLAWELFRDNPQRDWSFTDCTSRVLMERLHIKRALAFDHHFREFGNIETLL
jgi:predicted nucleic acid-binding protein